MLAACLYVPKRHLNDVSDFTVFYVFFSHKYITSQPWRWDLIEV